MKPISELAFYCCGVRMRDAASAHAICDDTYAQFFMEDEGRRIYGQFEEESASNASIIVRHRIIDDVLRQMLLAQPDLCIVNIGAGFDSRPYRLTGGTWFELDEPELLTYKNAHLPVNQCANPLRRIPINFCTDALQDKLATIAHAGPIVFILEGVIIYLEEEAIGQLLATVRDLFPQHRLICDLVKRAMVTHYGQTLQTIIAKIGTVFKAVDEPESVFLMRGYQVRQAISILAIAADLGLNLVPAFILRLFFQEEINGNAVYVLETNNPSTAFTDQNSAAQAHA